MANPYIGLRCPQDVYDQLEKYLNETGQKQTEYILSLIRKDLGIAKVETLIERVESLDVRITSIEARLDAAN